MSKRFSIVYRVEPDGSATRLIGRNAWALLELHRMGRCGCTPITTPGPRWSAYVLNLRNLGLSISTIYENHEGKFPGSHARYVLNSSVSILEVVDGKA
nr:hypothetical protein [uncultured Gellertiella sp.]